MEIPSVFLERAVSQFAGVPGIGRKTAMRLVLHLLKREPQDVVTFAQTMQELVENVR